MFEKLVIYRAHCDYCGRRHNLSAPKSALKTHLVNSGWKLTEDELVCPECAVKIVVIE